MANTHYNAYPTIIIANDYSIQTVGNDDTITTVSQPNFAFQIGISEDGTLWALSTVPDPDGGGAKIYWSQSPNQWNEINTSDPGGVAIAGGQGSQCFFISGDGYIYTMDTNGQVANCFSDQTVFEIGAGGGKLWAIYSENPGEIPSLFHSDWSPPFNFQKFNLGESATPYSISVGYAGNCYAIEDGSPVYYSKDGSSKGSAGSGADGKSLQITSKNWTYILSTDANYEGNEVLVWKDEAGGKFVKANFRAMSVLATYYMAA